MSKTYSSAAEAMVDHRIFIQFRRLTPWGMMHHLGNKEQVIKAWENLIVDYEYFDPTLRSDEPLHEEFALRFHVPTDTLYCYQIRYTIYTYKKYCLWEKVEGSLNYPLINYWRSIDHRKGKRQAKKKS